MHPLSHPRNALIVGIMFAVIAFLYWLTANLGHGHVDYAGITMLFALGIAMGLMAYVLIAGSPHE
jgi:apolipoprotein N-acyltransferase